MKKNNLRKRISEILKPLLSRSPIFTLFIILSSIVFISIILGTTDFSLKLLFLFIYISLLGFYFTGAIKNIIWYFISFIIILTIASLESLQLEIVSNGITGISFPSTLFSFFFSGFIFEVTSNEIKTGLKTLYSFLLTIINVILVIIIFNIVPNLNQYFVIFIPIILNILLFIVLIFMKKLKDSKWKKIYQLH